MNPFLQGDVLIIPYFPHQDDPQRGEPRYIIIVEDLGDVFEIIPMTKNIDQAIRYPLSFTIRQDSDEGKAMSLKYDSLIIPERRMTQIKRAFNGCFVVGRCSDELIDRLIQ